jgi:hypothetical protein
VGDDPAAVASKAASFAQNRPDVHFSMLRLFNQPRRGTYRALVASGALPEGYATEDGVGLHYRGTELNEAVTIRSGSRASWVCRSEGNGFVEEPVDARLV